MKSLLLLLSLVSPLSLCAKMKVVVSFSILKDFVEKVGGDEVEVTSLVGPDSDAHIFEPTPESGKAITGADLVVTNGLGFEGWIDRLIEATNYKGPILTASEGITPRQVEGSAKAVPDPHAWHDVVYAIVYVRNILKALVEQDPVHKEVYEKRAEAYVKDLESLHARIKKELEGVPAGKRRLITAHDAFHYFSERYGIQVLSAQGVSTEAQPSAKEIAALITQIKSEGIKALFVENISDAKLMAQIAQETGVTPSGTLYSDALGEAGGEAETYEKMMRHNVILIINAISLNESGPSEASVQ